MMKLCLFFACIGVVWATQMQEGGVNRPIAKIIKLLSDMRSQLEKEAKDDEEVYEKLSCWCKTNDREKDEAVNAAEAKIESLNATIEELTGKIAKKKEQIHTTDNELQANRASLEKEAQLRMKEQKAFSAEENDMVNAVQSCKQAITVLSKHNTAGLTQVQNSLRKALRPQVYSMMLSPGQEEKLKEFLSVSFLQAPFSSYNSQSGEIFGILKQIQEDFEKKLSASQADELAAREAFAALRKAKEEEIAAGEKKKAAYESDKAAAQEKKAEAEQDLADTTEQLDNDTKFLLSLRKRCKTTDEDYARRTKSRNEEIEAVGETISILNSDDSFDQFTKTVNTAEFLQLSSRRRRISARSRAAHMLMRSSDPRLSALAMRMTLDAFTKVKKAIDDMVSQLRAEMKDEVAHRDWCIAERNQNDNEQAQSQRTREDLEAKNADLKNTIETYGKEIDDFTAKIAEMKKQMTRAGDNRGKENTDFQQVVADQRITQQILIKARERMAQKYASLFQAAPHTELSGTKTDPGDGPARFAKYKVSGAGGKVIEMLTRVLTDSQNTEKEALRDEQDSQAAYEEFIQDGNKSIISYQNSVANKTEAKATSEETLVNSETDHSNILHLQETLHNKSNDLHESCDFVMANFDARQQSRGDEIESLRQAKGILSGASS